MKYEITKGSAKDFEGAPEWARFKTSSYYFEGFAQGLRWACIQPRNNTVIEEGVWFGGEEVYSHHRSRIIAERRPITEPVVNQQLTTEWDGEGLPPVGVECEYIGNDTSWGVVKVIGYDEGRVVFKPSGEDYYGITPSYKEVFRPLHTEEDLQRQSSTKAMNTAWRARAGEQKNDGRLKSIYEIIYEEIAAGKIPGITLSGK